MPRPITARDAILRAYESRWSSDDLARDYATSLMVIEGWDADVAEAAVMAAFNQHFRVMGGS